MPGKLIWNPKVCFTAVKITCMGRRVAINCSLDWDEGPSFTLNIVE